MKDAELEYKKALKTAPHLNEDFEQPILSYSTAIISPDFKNPLKSCHGCGTFLIISGHHGILTAAHVIEIFKKRKDNLIYIPIQNNLYPVTYKEIIILPDIKGIASKDLAFIVLNDEKPIFDSGKLFTTLDEENKFYKNEKFLDLSCGFCAASAEDKYVEHLNMNPILNLEYSGVYYGNPIKNSYSTESFYFPIFYPEQFQNKKILFDKFQVPFSKWKGIPNSFKGTSGSGFWGADILVDDNNHHRLVNLKLIGVIIEEIRILRRLSLRGPVSLYQTFLCFCTKVLNTGSIDLALNSIFISD